MKHWKSGKVILACDELKEQISGKKIALMMNTTALDNEGCLLLDRIVDEKWANVAFFLGMEHGVRGNLMAADSNLSAYDERTGIPIVNLYEYPEFKPPVERLKEVDCVVFCAQDVGVRHWSYTPWMMSLMDSSAEAGCEVIILDRPNPIRGDIVEGAPAQPPYAGTELLSGFEYPLRHGMTIGELALMYNDVKKIGAKITVLKMSGWKRDMWYEDTGLPWVPASPNMPTVDTALYFAATGLMQGADFSHGIGTTTPFQYVGGVGFDGRLLADTLNSKGLDGVYFLQKYYKTYTCVKGDNGEKMRENALCDGVLMLIQDRNVWRPVATQLQIMESLQELFGDQIDFEHHKLSRPRMCTDEICDALKNGDSLSMIAKKWESGANEFLVARAPYLLY
ncbi:MAG: DUF1343 domain-containing protein [Clostridia bacterium]|nr:DUF1343 domain-containing protein [Clostridia bacterium]